MSQKTVFISYSHDTPEHTQRVLQLANALRSQGVDVELDQYQVRPTQGWPQWCEERLRPENAAFVLMVCTDIFRQRVDGSAPADEGRGVYWEGRIIRNYLYDAKGNARFIPVLLDGATENAIPQPLSADARYHLHAFEQTDPGYHALYRELTGQPAVIKPPVGAVISVPPDAQRAVSPLSALPARNVMSRFVPGRVEPPPAGDGGELISPQEFADDKVRSAAIALNSSRADKSLTMRTLIGTLDGLFDRNTFRREPSVGLCVTKEWDIRLHSALQTLRLLEDHGPFVKTEAPRSWKLYRELTAEVSRYGERMAAFLFDPPVGPAGLRNLVGTEGFIHALQKHRKLFTGANAKVDRETCNEIDPHLTKAIDLMDTLHVEFCDPSEYSGAKSANLATSARSPALGIWQKKLEFLQTEEAKASNAEQKFSIQQRIEEAKAKIQELGG